MRATLLALLLLALLVAPVAAAQTTINPIEGDYNEVYLVSGRVLDADGLPFSGGRVVVELLQEGVKGADGSAPKQSGAVNCKGDFIIPFTSFARPSRDGKVRVTAFDGATPLGSVEGALDPFWRRTDVSLRLASEWGNECTGNQNVWTVSATVNVRLLNRTDPYTIGDASFDARPYHGFLRLRYEPPGAATICPPKPNAPGVCEQFLPDERGDVRYTFTLDQPFEAGGRVFVLLPNHTAEGCDPGGGTCLEVPVDPVTRLGLRYFEMTGRGVPEPKDAPGAAPAFVVALLGLAALGSRSLLGRRRG